MRWNQRLNQPKLIERTTLHEVKERKGERAEREIKRTNSNIRERGVLSEGEKYKASRKSLTKRANDSVAVVTAAFAQTDFRGRFPKCHGKSGSQYTP